MNKYYGHDFDLVRTDLYFPKIFTNVMELLSEHLPLYRAMPKEMFSKHFYFSLYISDGLVNRYLKNNVRRIAYDISQEDLEEMVYSQITPEIIDNCVAYQVERFLSKNDIKVLRKK